MPLDHPNSWKGLYLAAVLENDKAVLPRRIAQARTAIVQQGRELFHGPSACWEERHALDGALYSLDALANCLHIGERAKVAVH